MMLYRFKVFCAKNPTFAAVNSVQRWDSFAFYPFSKTILV
jgi:hypothetical protein